MFMYVSSEESLSLMILSAFLLLLPAQNDSHLLKTFWTELSVDEQDPGSLIVQR